MFCASGGFIVEKELDLTGIFIVGLVERGSGLAVPGGA